MLTSQLNWWKSRIEEKAAFFSSGVLSCKRWICWTATLVKQIQCQLARKQPLSLNWKKYSYQVCPPHHSQATGSWKQWQSNIEYLTIFTQLLCFSAYFQLMIYQVRWSNSNCESCSTCFVSSSGASDITDVGHPWHFMNWIQLQHYLSTEDLAMYHNYAVTTLLHCTMPC